MGKSKEEFELVFYDFYSLILSNKFVEAFDKYYDETILVIDQRHGIVKGKDKNLKNRRRLRDSIIEVKNIEVRSAALDNDVSIVEWDINAEMKRIGLRSFNFVVIQNWKDGKIVKEKYFNAPSVA